MKQFLTLVLLFACPFVYAQSWQQKLDVHFLRQISVDQLQDGKTKTKTTVAPYHAFILLSDESKTPVLTQLGVEVRTQAGQVLTALIAPELLAKVAALPFVLRIELAKKTKLTNSGARTHIGADKVYAGQLTNGLVYTGKDVLVGIYDSGIDFTHPDFRKTSNLKQSRILYLWDQTISTGSAPAPFGYGSQWNQAQISNEIDGTPTGALSAHKDQIGHGTHVAGTAAGSKGIAYEADIIFVKGALSGATGFEGLSTEIVDAVKYIYDRAVELNKPCVVNLSLGTHSGAPHNGESLMEIALDNLVKSRPGFILVIAAGNEGDSYIHMSKKSNVTDSSWIYMRPVITGTPVEGYFTFPYTLRSQVQVAFALDSTRTEFDDKTTPMYQTRWYTLTELINMGSMSLDVTRRYSSDVVGTISVDAGSFNSNSDELLVSITEEFDLFSNVKNMWRIMFKGNLDVHGWLEAGSWGQKPALNILPYYANYIQPDNAYCIGMPGTAKYALTVGAYVNRQHYVNAFGSLVTGDNSNNDPAGTLAYFSSTGPSTDNRIKPEITAPGLNVISALSKDAMLFTPNAKVNDFRWAQSGTSMATPVTAGAIALYLQKYPYANYQQVMMAVQANAVTDASTASNGALPNSYWGYGKLNIFNMLNSSLPAGVNDIYGSGLVMLYPNPATQTSAIVTNADLHQANILVMDLSGKVVFWETGVNLPAGEKKELNVSSWSKGLYVVQIVTEENNFTGKLRVQ